MDSPTVQIVEIAIPLPSAVIPFAKDDHGRNAAEIPGVGRIVELPEDEAELAREAAKERPTAETVAFDLTFSDGRKGLFVRASDLDDSATKTVSA